MNFISRTLAAAAVTIAFSLPAFAQYLPASSAAFSGLPNQTGTGGFRTPTVSAARVFRGDAKPQIEF